MVVMTTTWTGDTHLKSFPRAAILATGLYTYLVIFWLIFAPLSRICLRLYWMSLGLISLAEEIFRQAAIGFVVWLLVVTLMWVYNETEQAGQEEIQKVEFEEKRGTRECNVGAQAHADTDKEGSYSKSNKGNGAPGQNSTQLILQFAKGRGLRGFLVLKNNTK